MLSLSKHEAFERTVAWDIARKFFHLCGILSCSVVGTEFIQAWLPPTERNLRATDEVLLNLIKQNGPIICCLFRGIEDVVINSVRGILWMFRNWFVFYGSLSTCIKFLKEKPCIPGSPRSRCLPRGRPCQPSRVRSTSEPPAGHSINQNCNIIPVKD